MKYGLPFLLFYFNQRIVRLDVIVPHQIFVMNFQSVYKYRKRLIVKHRERIKEILKIGGLHVSCILIINFYSQIRRLENDILFIA